METMEYYKKVEDKAKELIPNFKKIELYDILADYFKGGKECLDRGYDPNKGLLIVGDIGTGKTQCFEVFRELLRNSNRFFQVVSTRQVIRDYTINGAKVLNEYGRESKTPIYFDDLGLEEVNVKMYGNTANVMSEILLDRYDNYKRHGVKTFASSNLGAEKFEEIYGARVRDRLKEMMNFIIITGESFRK